MSLTPQELELAKRAIERFKAQGRITVTPGLLDAQPGMPVQRARLYYERGFGKQNGQEMKPEHPQRTQMNADGIGGNQRTENHE